ncbi:MAG: hypothetical protein B7X46_13015 [Thiomonas sp. 15-66-11]|jgi:hypothetical protein|nr:MAG: hypothetical protein B7X46_13015 [Thiomonas sp. 15-66-11]
MSPPDTKAVDWRIGTKERIMREWNATPLRLRREWIALQAGDSMLLRGARGLRVEATPSPFPAEPAPLLWLTEEGALDDVFLRPGDSHVLRGNGRVVATAWGPISVRVVKAAVRGMAYPTPPAIAAGGPGAIALPAPRPDGRPAMQAETRGGPCLAAPRLPPACCGA